MDTSGHALKKTRDYISLLSSSVCVPDIRHPHQAKIIVLRVELFHALSHYDGFDNPVVLLAFRNRRANGCGYYSAVITEYHSVDSLRFPSAHIRSTADRGLLRAHHVEHFHVAGFFLHCSDFVSPFGPSTALLDENCSV